MQTKILKRLISVICAVNIIISSVVPFVGAIKLPESASMEYVRSVEKLNVSIGKLKTELSKFREFNLSIYREVDEDAQGDIACGFEKYEKLLSNAVFELGMVEISEDSCDNELLRCFKEVDRLIDNIIRDIEYCIRKVLNKNQVLMDSDIKIFKFHTNSFNSYFLKICWADEKNSKFRDEFNKKVKEYNEKIENFEKWTIIENIKRKDDVTKTSRSRVIDYYRKHKGNFDVKKAEKYIELINGCMEEMENFKDEHSKRELLNIKQRIDQKTEDCNENVQENIYREESNGINLKLDQSNNEDNKLEDINFNGMDIFQSLNVDNNDNNDCDNDNILKNDSVDMSCYKSDNDIDKEIDKIVEAIMDILRNNNEQLRLPECSNTDSSKLEDINFNGMDVFHSLDFENNDNEYSDNRLINQSVNISWSQIIGKNKQIK